MSHTLILRLAGPMQSWGVSSRFGIRETLLEPSKSGVIGLLCAALGWDRAEATHTIAGRERSLSDLSEMPFGVRVIKEGVLRRDYHTAQNVLRASAKLKPGKPANPGDLQNTVLSERYYLSDAHFLAGLESDDLALLQALDDALANPHWPLSLGRKAFVPAWPVHFALTGDAENSVSGVMEKPLAEALLTANDPVLPSELAGKVIRLVMDASGSGLTGYQEVVRAQRTDVPLSFDARRFEPREVLTYIKTAHVPD